MAMRIVARARVPAEKIKPWSGKHPNSDHYDYVLDGTVDLLGPDGKIILAVRRGFLTQQVMDDARPVFKWMKKFPSDNRSKYAGAPTHGKMIKADGTRSKSLRALDDDGNRVEVHSTIAGYYERQGGRHPFCRATAVTRKYPDKWAKLVPFFQECANVYKSTCPEKYKVQTEYCNRVDNAWIIPGTPFSTVTVNNTVPAAYHQDGGDLKDGMGCMAVLREGEYQGFELVVPELRAAVNLRDGDVLLFDPTAWHGNVPPFDTYGAINKDWGRVSVVMYYREGILGCLSPEEELARAKNRGAL